MLKEQKDNRKLIKIIISSFILLGLIYLIPVGIYFNSFHQNGLSSNIDDWVSFSNFIGGILSPFLALINILVLISLSFLVYRWDTERNEKAIETQKIISKNQIRYDALKDIRRIKEKVFEIITKNDEKKMDFDLYNTALEFEGVNKCNKFLFNYCNEEIENNEIVESIKNLARFAHESNNPNSYGKKDKIEEDSYLREFMDKYDNFYTKLIEEIENK